MKEEDKNITRLLRIEEAINEIMTVGERIAELKVQMKALKASEKKFKTLVENIPQKIYLKDRASVYIFCNDKYAADLKIKAEDIAGKTDYEFFPKELADKYVADDKRIMATGQLEEMEEEYVREGKTVIVHAVKTPVKDEKGETGGILSILGDITEQKRTERELRKNLASLGELISDREAELEAVRKEVQREITQRELVKQGLQEMEKMFWTFFENAGTACVMIAETLNINWANREFEKLSGYPKEEVERGKSLAEFLTPDVVEKIKEFYHAGRTNLATVLRDHECHFHGHWGNVTDIRITAAIVPGAQKAVVSLLDITDRKRAEESLRELQKKFQAMVENTNEAILVVQDGWPKFGNPKFFGISGYTEEELTSRPFEEFIPAEDRGIMEEQLRKLRDGESPQAYFRIIQKEGDLRCLENRAALIQWEKRPAVLIFMTDGTDRTKADEKAVATKNKDHLIRLFEKLLKTDLNLNFLSKLEAEDLENLAACIRDRVDQGKK